MAPVPSTPPPPARAARPAPKASAPPEAKSFDAPSFDDDSPFGAEDLGLDTASAIPGAETVNQAAPRAVAPSVAKAPAAKQTTSVKVATATSTTSPVQIAAPKKDKGFPHFTHMGISLCTLFLWTPFWLLHYVIWKTFQKKAKGQAVAS